MGSLGIRLDMKHSRFLFAVIFFFLYSAGELYAVEDTDVSTGEQRREKEKKTALSECLWEEVRDHFVFVLLLDWRYQALLKLWLLRNPLKY